MSTLDWFGMIYPTHLEMLSTDLKGATTFRFRTRGVTIFLDTWLDRPSILKTYLPVDDVQEADYIFISHAHFDQ
jgi:L-ascorbate metabolism protein UlaG (beta-lactamase superfamily)